MNLIISQKIYLIKNYLKLKKNIYIVLIYLLLSTIIKFADR